MSQLSHVSHVFCFVFIDDNLVTVSHVTVRFVYCLVNVQSRDSCKLHIFRSIYRGESNMCQSRDWSVWWVSINVS